MNCIQLGAGISYEEGLDRQNAAVDALLDGIGSEVLFLLEHSPIYTIGRLRDTSSLRNPSALPAPVIETNRGGQATYHGPGQLVGYPILDLRARNRDLHAHLRGIEEALIRTCRDFAIAATRRDGLTGVWVENRKLASIGVGVRKWISMHGFAINISPESLLPFFAITPCGIDGVIMSCAAQEAPHPLTVADFSEALLPHFRSVFL
ncbi:MAG: lipoyl(octanoyl) transferase LipB [Verrucomicrobia bacterium]|nr:MAG: lipoyl(octanoyl) transferase LipB [Verrucomicrobiota bacterium]TAE89116.1 MAG: lipoyl(octanoyl) transferase LipB [Verrucomicrobiota bacterium]TAF28011.1 MAG: lipoyl(octanoyl) transferase LipB [Verrucomicrobiota bacterium]TAF42858.1 MAG: lipoyl(octanoyl) transferase LipB [Verrucomicrobiota bacterium]